MKISIIVPVFNSELYIEKCILSLVQQDISDYEVICIDDGSTDKSGVILDCLANKYSQLVVHHQENQGVSKAREKGIKLAKGEYIGFCDSDDTIDKKMFATLLKKIEQFQADMCVCAYKRIKSDISKIEMAHFGNKVYEIDKIPEILPVINTALWNKIIKADIVKKHISFDYAPRIAEDMMFLLSIYPYMQKICFCEEPMYNYYVRNESAMSYAKKDELGNIMNAMIAVKDKVNKTYRDDIFWRDVIAIFAFLHIAISISLRLPKNQDRWSIFQSIEKYLNEEFPCWKKNFYLKWNNANMWRVGLYKIKCLQIMYRMKLFYPLTDILIKNIKW